MKRKAGASESPSELTAAPAAAPAKQCKICYRLSSHNRWNAYSSEGILAQPVGERCHACQTAMLYMQSRGFGGTEGGDTPDALAALVNRNSHTLTR